MTDQNDVLTIAEGTDVFGSDREKIGKVDRVESTYIVVSKGWFFPSDHFIPVEAIATAAEDGVQLTVTKDEALSQGWENEPGAADSTPYVDQTMTAGVGTTPVGGSTDTLGSTERTDQPFDQGADRTGTQRDDTDNIRVPLTEEELTATRRPVERGAVRVEKDVVSEERTLDVPVTEERVNVSRRTVDREVAPGEDAFQGGTIEVPVHGEEVDVEKRAHVREELEISKDAEQRTERVTDTVRREEARVEDGTETVDRDDNADRRRSS